MTDDRAEDDMWWQDLLWGVWNGITAWVVLIAHVFGAWEQIGRASCRERV